MYGKRHFSSRTRCVQSFHLCGGEPLEARYLMSGDPAFDPNQDPAADWGIAAIDAPAAWATGFTGQGVTVAVIDSGVALDHPTLADRLWSNADEVPGNGRDDDANGFIDDELGWDFVDSDNRPNDPAGHGTHVAGIVAAGLAPPDELETQGGAGEALGVAPGARIMPVRVLDGYLRGANRDIAAGIRYAADNGADIINLSIGGKPNQAILAAIEYAAEHDVLVVAAAGNDARPEPGFPAAYSATHGNVLSAGAFRQSGALLEDSNLVGASGAVQVDAPGQNIRSTFVAAPFGYQSGTSMAAPHVAGLAALLLSANPNLSAAQLREAIVSSVDPPAAGSDSAGTINAARALARALRTQAVPALPSVEQAITASVAPPLIQDPIDLAPAAPLPIVADVPAAPRQQGSRLVTASSVVPVGWLTLLPRATGQQTGLAAPLSEEFSPRSVRSGLSPGDIQRALTTAALLAYHVETGTTAMHWVEDGDAPKTPPKDRGQQSAVTADQDAAEPHARPPHDASAAKMARR